ncbi:unnamed protein product, partial [Cuscuta europaea]
MARHRVLNTIFFFLWLSIGICSAARTLLSLDVGSVGSKYDVGGQGVVDVKTSGYAAEGGAKVSGTGYGWGGTGGGKGGREGYDEVGNNYGYGSGESVGGGYGAGGHGGGSGGGGGG